MIETRLTRQFGLKHPIIAAPMALASGGRLAAAVSRAGGMGLIGGGYGDPNWLRAEFENAGDTPVGCGFITWSLARQPELLDQVLAYGPTAIFLSFGDPADFAPRIARAKVPLICQVQTLRDARHAVDCGAAVIVAQGSEAGGHGERRATMTLVPEIADYLAGAADDVLLCAAGGIGDGRGLAASLMLGADGVVVGSRLWASQEALVPTSMQQAAMRADGDDTIRSTIVDIVRGKDWPARYSCRILENDFSRRWHGHDQELASNETARAEWNAGLVAGDPDRASAIVGEVTGLIHDIPAAGDIIESMAAQAQEHLTRGMACLTKS